MGETTTSPAGEGGAVEAARWSVLLAEDDELHARALTEIVQSTGQFAVIACARDGQEAIEFAKALAPDVVVMDIRMPLLDGIAATRHLRASGSGPPVLLISGLSYDERAAEALNAGAADYIRKGRITTDLPNALLAAVTP
jgi:CheY-like chemotaxis protein